MADVWLAEREEAGFPYPFPTSIVTEAVEVSNVGGGCYDVDGTVRATFDSLMNDGLPVLGSVNRRWAEEILDLWQGEPRS